MKKSGHHKTVQINFFKEPNELMETNITIDTQNSMGGLNNRL